MMLPIGSVGCVRLHLTLRVQSNFNIGGEEKKYDSKNAGKLGTWHQLGNLAYGNMAYNEE